MNLKIALSGLSILAALSLVGDGKDEAEGNNGTDTCLAQSKKHCESD